MGFFKDILGGGGDLHRKIIPRELRKLAPNEIQPGGFDPARDWFGFDIKANPERDAMLARQAQEQAAQAAFMNAPQQPIPGAGMAAPAAPLPAGAYGQQALLLAGLLGRPPPAAGHGGQSQQLGLLGGMTRPVMQPPFTPGRFMPGWQPGDPLIRGGGGTRRRVQPY